jgi:cytochrome c biogenesis protein ResB
VEIRQGGDLIASEPITFVQDTAPEGVPQLAMPWRGILKLPSLDPQMGMTFVLWPDSRAWLQLQTTGQPVAMTQSFQPIMFYKVYRGDLTDPSLTSLDTSVMRTAGEGVVGAEQTVDLRTGIALEGGATTTGLTVSFPELRQYSVLQVSRDRGVPLVLLAAILVLLGLLPALYTSRRKVWVRAESNGNGTVLKVGGFALQRKPQFDEEFSKLVDAMARAAGGDSSVEEKERVSSA